MTRPILLLFVLLISIPALYAQTDTTDENVISYTFPSEYVIKHIAISGTRTLNPDIIKTLSGLREGSTVNIPGDDLANAVRLLWDQKLFVDVKLYITKKTGRFIDLEINLTEKPRLNKHDFPGIKKGEQDDLNEQIRLIPSRPVTENLKLNAHRAIKKFYAEKGFLDVEIKMVEEPLEMQANMVDLHIYIKKGKKVKISNINITGVEELSARKVEKRMKETKEKPKFRIREIFKLKNIREFRRQDSISFGEGISNLSPTRMMRYLDDKVKLNIFGGSKFVKAEYKADKQNIITYYNSKGYRDARIVRDSVYREGGHLEIDIEIDEGRKYYFRDITWKGNTKYKTEDLDKVLGIKKGAVYNQALLDEKLSMSATGNDISSLYMDDGYLFFQVTPQEVAVDGDSIDVDILIQEGPQAVINKIIIEGNTKTNEHVIRRELRVMPGNKFSRSDLIRSQREIVNLGYFDPEQLDVRPIPNPNDGTVDILFKVAEKPSDRLELSAGWGGAGRGVVGTVGISFTNFSLNNMFKKGSWSPLPSGDGQQLSLRIQTNGRLFQSYNMSFTEPWLGGKKPNSFTVSWFHNRFADLDANRDVEGRFLIFGGSLGFGTRLKWPDDYFIFQMALNYQRYSLDNWNQSNFIITDGNSNNLSLKLVLSRNSIDQPIYPTRGSNLTFSLQLTPPYSSLTGKDFEGVSDNVRYKWIEYHKWRFDAEWFLPISKSAKRPIVFRLAAKFGFLGFYNSDIGYSPFERYELGGDGIQNFQFVGRDIISLRGYDVITPSTGAPFFNKVTAEVRFPISLNPQATIYTLAFLEGGNYWNNIKDFNPFDMKRSAGLGVRIFLPMFGMLGFDYGIGFDKDLASPTGFGDLLSRYGKFTIILGVEPQ